MVISLLHFLVLSSVIFTIGVSGLFTKAKSLISTLLAIELMLLAVNINFVAFSAFSNDIRGQIFTIFILTIAAAEIAIGLSILVIYYKNKGNIKIQEMNLTREI